MLAHFSGPINSETAPLKCPCIFLARGAPPKKYTDTLEFLSLKFYKQAFCDLRSGMEVDLGATVVQSNHTGVLMKSLFFAVLLAGMSAFAGGPNFEIISGDVKPEHGGPFNTGSIAIDYTAKTISLEINRNRCPKGMYCTMEARLPYLVSLPIVSIQKDSCHNQIVTAQEDLRPADGDLRQLTVYDFSKNTCPTFTEIIGNAEYLTSGTNRIENKTETVVSTFQTKYVATASSAAVLLEKTMQVGFAAPEHMGRFSLEILADGQIQRRDNKNQIAEVGQLTSSELSKISKLVAGLGKVNLIRPNEQGCIDAPSYSIVAHQDAQDIELWNRIDCLESKTKNKNAKALIRIINQIDVDHPDHQ
jgi:hypothetical protein